MDEADPAEKLTQEDFPMRLRELVAPATKRWLIASLLVGLMLPGCGPSKQDLLMRAAQRRRPTAADEEPEPPKPAKKKAPPKVAVAASPKPEAKEEPKEEKPVELSIKPIDERRPESPAAAGGRRTIAVRNLNRIAEAMRKYEEEWSGYPRPWKKIEGGFKGLSWRVELLPYLGYQDLYDKFDQTVSWNQEPNKSLLKYIPDEFVSPERYDTKTNWLVPVHPRFSFGGGRFAAPAKMDEEDGAINTIILLEADNHAAVEWTSPNDWSPKKARQMSQELGGLRKDGTLALWGNCFPTILSNKVSDEDLYAAFTWDAGESFQAAKIHKDVPSVGLSDAESEKGSFAAKLQEEMDELAESEAAMEEVPVVPTEPAVVGNRKEVPNAIAIARASDVLRTLYGSKAKAVRSGIGKANLANEMLNQADKMKSDEAGVYAIETAALAFAAQSGDANVLIRALDHRIMNYEVDAYQTHLDIFTRYADDLITGRGDMEGSAELLRRLMEVVHATIREDDYVRSSQLTQLAARLSQRTGQPEITRRLVKLRSALNAARVEHEKAVKSLELYRQFPTDVESAAAFGRFLCFFKGDWKTGLPLVVKAGSPDLVATAEMDLLNPTDVSSQVDVADAWWNLSERARGVYQQASRDRAMKWYMAAFARMPESLDRMHVKGRLDDGKNYEPASPMALCASLGKTFGSDLTQSLISISSNKGAGRRKPGQDDDDDDDD